MKIDIITLTYVNGFDLSYPRNFMSLKIIFYANDYLFNLH